MRQIWLSLCGIVKGAGDRTRQLRKLPTEIPTWKLRGSPASISCRGPQAWGGHTGINGTTPRLELFGVQPAFRAAPRLLPRASFAAAELLTSKFTTGSWVQRLRTVPQ